MDAYLTLQLRYCLLHMRECSRLFGVPYAPRKEFSVLSLNTPNVAGQEIQVPSYDEDNNIIWLENEIAGLPDRQRAVINRLLSGERVYCNNKNLKAAREHIRNSLNSAELLYA
jgi:hypothetical protein